MRLIDSENIEDFAYEESFGTKDMVENWIAEIEIPFDVKIEYEEELKVLCWKALEASMNIIKTEPTACDLDKMVKRLEDEHINCYTTGDYKYNNAIDKALEIVETGGIDALGKDVNEEKKE